MLTSQSCGGLSPLSAHAQATIEKHLPSAKKLLRNINQLTPQKRDASCITDLCSSDCLPEVEIFSLLEEQIPKYKIRSDPMTTFGGYENQDWFVPCPALKISTEGIGLNKDQCRETLNYFLLSGERLSQMTKTYDDIEAVTRLLEEKEKDLELTVQIGKELLTQNIRLEHRVTDLEINLKTVNDSFQQTSHDLFQKNELIAILTNDVNGTSIELDDSDDKPGQLKPLNLGFLEKKISSLQGENVSLRSEVMQLVQETDEIEEKEKQLMQELTRQLSSRSDKFDGINFELERHKEENSLLHEQLSNTTERLNDTEIRFHELSSENDETSSLLSITKENQNLLASELAEFKLRYNEVLALLNETQEQLRNARKRGQPVVRSSLISGLPIPQVDSLQSELMETSMFSDNSLDSGIALDRLGSTGSIPGYKKVFETVRCAAKANNFADNTNMLYLGAMSMSSSSQPKMTPYIQSNESYIPQAYRTSSMAYTSSLCPSIEGSMGARISSRDSLLMSSDSETNYPGQATFGCPGAPGAKDLEAALNRLTPAEVLARRSMLQHAPAGTYNYGDDNVTNLPHGCRSPDSVMSFGSFSMTNSGISHHQWRLPEKLMIVKPMEGSQTLKHWNQLATPTLSGLLDERPGVTIRGGRGLDDLGLQMYNLDDCEEDPEDHPGKRFPTSNCVYTFTNSTVMHPDDGSISSVPSSQLVSRMTSANVSRQHSASVTPRSNLSRRNSCSTFSVSLGLASMLNERGIKAVTPSALNTPCGFNYSPTVTPCNSPEGTPMRFTSPEPQFFSGLISSGADLLRRKLIGEHIELKHQSPIKLRAGNKITLTRLERRALKSIRILEKVENMGLESIGSSSTSSVCTLPPIHGSSTMYNRSSSPMTQLTSLNKKLHNMDGGDKVHIDSETIKAVLSKGLSNDSLKSPDTSDFGCESSSDDTAAGSITMLMRSNRSSETRDGVPGTPGTGALSQSRIKLMQRQKSRRHMKNGGQRPDLGTVGSSSNLLLKNKESDKSDSQSIGFIGQISSLLFGRKGGLL